MPSPAFPKAVPRSPGFPQFVLQQPMSCVSKEGANITTACLIEIPRFDAADTDIVDVTRWIVSQEIAVIRVDGSTKKRRYNGKNRPKRVPVERFQSSATDGLIEQEKFYEDLPSACQCKHGSCGEAFLKSPTLAKTLWDSRQEFHSMLNRADRRVHLSRIICKVGEDSVSLFGVPVCVSFLRNSLHISNNMYYGVLRKLQSGISPSHVLAQPHKTGVNKRDIFCGWLLDLARLHADPQPDKDFAILPFKSRQCVYDEYNYQREESLKLGQEETLPELSFAYMIWCWKYSPLARKIVIRKCLRFAICDECIGIQKLREKTNDRQLLKELRTREKRHLDFVKAERQYYAARVAEARADYMACLSVALDGADQGAFGVPFYCQPSKTSQTIFKFRQYVVGVVIHGVGVKLYRHLSKFPRGANVTISILHQMLLCLWRSNGGVLPRKMYLQMDNCWRENKNKYVFAFLSDLVLKDVFDDVYVSFLIKGHTHFDPDQVFSRISTRLKIRNAFSPSEFKKQLRKSYKPEPDVYDLDIPANISDHIDKGDYLLSVKGLTVPHVFHIKAIRDDWGSVRAGIFVKNFWHTSHITDPWSTDPIFLLKRPIAYTEVPDSIVRAPKRQHLDEMVKGVEIFRKYEPNETAAADELQACAEELLEINDPTKVWPFNWELNDRNEPPYMYPEHGRLAPRGAFSNDAIVSAIPSGGDGGYSEDEAENERGPEQRKSDNDDVYDYAGLLKDRELRQRCGSIVLGRNDAALNKTGRQKKDMVGDEHLMVNDFVCVKSAGGDRLPYYVGRVKDIFVYQQYKAPERWREDLAKDPGLKFLEVHWWQPVQKEGWEKNYDCSLGQAIRQDASGAHRDHIEVISEDAVMMCFKTFVNSNGKTGQLERGKVPKKVRNDMFKALNATLGVAHTLGATPGGGSGSISCSSSGAGSNSSSSSSSGSGGWMKFADGSGSGSSSSNAGSISSAGSSSNSDGWLEVGSGDIGAEGSPEGMCPAHWKGMSADDRRIYLLEHNLDDSGGEVRDCKRVGGGSGGGKLDGKKRCKVEVPGGDVNESGECHNTMVDLIRPVDVAEDAWATLTDAQRVEALEVTRPAFISMPDWGRMSHEGRAAVIALLPPRTQ